MQRDRIVGAHVVDAVGRGEDGGDAFGEREELAELSAGGQAGCASVAVEYAEADGAQVQGDGVRDARALPAEGGQQGGPALSGQGLQVGHEHGFAVAGGVHSGTLAESELEVFEGDPRGVGRVVPHEFETGAIEEAEGESVQTERGRAGTGRESGQTATGLCRGGQEGGDVGGVCGHRTYSLTD